MSATPQAPPAAAAAPDPTREFMRDLEFEIHVKKAAVVVAIFAVLWFLPCPEGVDPKGWKVMACFVSTIASFLIGPMPMGATVLLAITICGCFLPLKETLAGFSHSQVWLIVMAFLISRGFSKTGLGLRIAYHFIRLLGGNPRGLAVAVGLSTYCMAPAMPSSTARSGGTIMPLVRSMSHAFGSYPDRDRRKIGSYLMLCAFNTNYPTGASYMTAMAGNPLAVTMALTVAGVELTWLNWWLYMLIPGLVTLILTPFVIYAVYPPELKKSAEAQAMAAERLKEMGPMTKPQALMAVAFVLLLVLWVFGDKLHVNATIAAFIGILFLVFTGVLTWKDVLNESGAYNCMFWYAGLLMMAPALNEYGVIKWATSGVAGFVSGMPWFLVLVIGMLCCTYFAYCFASSTAFISALYPAILAICVAGGVPPITAAIALAACCNYQACLTYYSGGSGPIFYAQNYVTPKEWIRTGFFVSVSHLLCLLTVGMLWWKIIGIW